MNKCMEQLIYSNSGFSDISNKSYVSSFIKNFRKNHSHWFRNIIYSLVHINFFNIVKRYIQTITPPVFQNQLF